MPNDWRESPKLKGRFLPGHPDDLQVIVHDGGPRITHSAPEVVWVTVTGMDGEVFHGQVLNQPHSLRTVRQGAEIKFVMPDGSEHPVMVTTSTCASAATGSSTRAASVACRNCSMPPRTSCGSCSPTYRLAGA